MEQVDIHNAIENFMQATIYTGVKPILLVAEELVTDKGLGQVVEAVWLGINSSKEFSYISKFAVSGKIILGKYYEKDEMEPFRGRVALVNTQNLEKVVLHKDIISRIKDIKSKRAELLDSIEKDFDKLEELYKQDKELYLFKSKDGDWEEEFFSYFDIDSPYKVIGIEKNVSDFRLHIKNIKTGVNQEYTKLNQFYTYFVGSLAELNGLKLKSESYLASIVSLEAKAKKIIQEIEWLDLDDPQIQAISQSLPKHPFENYFPYVKKEDVREVQVDDALVESLKSIILKHMPENNTPLGMEYIAIDKLLYLFHMIISRDEALEALKSCDVIYEPPAIILGHGGERKLPPKYLLSIRQVASAYEKFPSFVSICKEFS